MLGEKFTPQDFDFYRDKGRAERQGIDSAEAGPINSETSDNEIRQRAARYAHRFGAPAAFVEYMLMLERRLAGLETASRKSSPHMAKVERRTK